MISMYTGSVGSGKSFHALALGLKVLNESKNGQKRSVIANFPIKPKKDVKMLPKKLRDKVNAKRKEKFDRWIYIDEITPDFLMAQSIINGWYGKEGMCMVIIDEAGIIFNARDWSTKAAVMKKWNKFLALSRKFGYDFIFITQSDRMLDKQIRSMAEYDVKHVKANYYWMFSWLSLFGITLFLARYKWMQMRGKGGQLKTTLYRQRIANRYDTMRIFDYDELIGAVRALYDGKVIPAAVATQIATWEQEQIDRALELEEKQSEMEDGEGENVEEHLDADAS